MSDVVLCFCLKCIITENRCTNLCFIMLHKMFDCIIRMKTLLCLMKLCLKIAV